MQRPWGGGTHKGKQLMPVWQAQRKQGAGEGQGVVSGHEGLASQGEAWLCTLPLGQLGQSDLVYFECR